MTFRLVIPSNPVHTVSTGRNARRVYRADPSHFHGRTGAEFTLRSFALWMASEMVDVPGLLELSVGPPKQSFKHPRRDDVHGGRQILQYTKRTWNPARNLPPIRTRSRETNFVPRDFRFVDHRWQFTSRAVQNSRRLPSGKSLQNTTYRI